MKVRTTTWSSRPWLARPPAPPFILRSTSLRRLVVTGFVLAGSVRAQSNHPVNSSTVAFAQAYTVTDLGTLGGDSSAQGINNAGWIVGNAGWHGFLYTNGVMQDLGTFGGSQSWAFGVNSSNQVAGGAQATNVTHAFLWTGGVMQQIGAGVGARVAFAINNLGHCAGYLKNYNGYYHAYVYGISPADLGTLGGSYSYAYGINDSDQVTGWAEITPGGFQRAFRYSGGGMSSIGTLGGYMSHAYGINNLGQVVGWSALSNGTHHAFLHNGASIVDLNTLIPTNSGWTLTAANAINDNGQIVGQGINPSANTRAFLLTPIPMITAAAVLPTGTVGVAYSATLTATNAALPFTWSITSNSLPDGLSLDSATGLIHGTPTTYGTTNFVVRCTASDAQYGEKPCTLTINPTVWQAWQLTYFGCTACPQADPDADPLGKGLSNTNQFLVGLNPTNAASVFRIIAVVATGNECVVTWKTAGPRTNVVQATATGLDSTNFQDLVAIIISTGGDVTTNYTDVGGATNGSARFYRIRLGP